MRNTEEACAGGVEGTKCLATADEVKEVTGPMAQGTGAFALSALEGTGRFAAAGDVV